MFEKISILLILYFAILAYDGPKLKQKNRKERLAYGGMMLITVYLGLDYVMESDWPNLNDMINFFFADPAKRIVESVKLPS